MNFIDFGLDGVGAAEFNVVAVAETSRQFMCKMASLLAESSNDIARARLFIQVGFVTGIGEHLLSNMTGESLMTIIRLFWCCWG